MDLFICCLCTFFFIVFIFIFFFFFNDTATTEIYTLSLHDALPITPPVRTPTSPPPRSNLPASRVLLLLPTSTYRTTAFVEAARRVGAPLTVASERPSTFEAGQPDGLLTLDFAHPERAARQ